MSVNLNRILEKFPTGSSSISGVDTPQLLCGLRQLITTLHQRSPAYSSFINAIAGVPQCLTDYQLEKGSLGVADIPNGLIQISESDADEIVGGLEYAANTLKDVNNDATNNILWVTEASGRAFGFMNNFTDVTIEGDFEPLIGYCQNLETRAVLGKTEMLLYKENGKYYLNTLLNGATGVLGDVAALLKPDINMFSPCDYLTSDTFIPNREVEGEPFPNTSQSLLYAQLVYQMQWMRPSCIPPFATNGHVCSIGHIRALMGYEDDDWKSPCAYILSRYMDITFDDALEMLPDFQGDDRGPGRWQHPTFQEDPRIFNLIKMIVSCRSTAGVSSLYSLVGNMIEADCINDAIVKISGALITGAATVSNIATVVDETIRAKYASVRSIVQGVMQAFNFGGIRAAATYIFRYVQSTANLEVDEDGLIKFTDNASMKPRQYITGLILDIANTINMVCATIFAYVTKGITLVIGGVVSGIIEFIKKTISADKSETYASLTNEDTSIEDLAPIAFGQFDCGNVYAFLQAMHDQESPGCFVRVPGGALIASGDLDNRKTRWEFHPSCMDTHETFGDSSFTDTDGYDFSLTASGVFGLREFAITRAEVGPFTGYDVLENSALPYFFKHTTTNLIGYANTNQLPYPSSWFHLWDRWRDYNLRHPERNFSNQESNGHLSANEDKRMRLAIISNIAIFSLFWLSVTQDSIFSKSDYTRYTDEQARLYNKCYGVLTQNSGILGTGYPVDGVHATSHDRPFTNWIGSTTYYNGYQNYVDGWLMSAVALARRSVVASNKIVSWVDIVDLCTSITNVSNYVDDSDDWFTFDPAHYYYTGSPAGSLLSYSSRVWNPHLDLGIQVYSLFGYKNSWFIYIPKYDASTFTACIIEAAIITAVVVAVAVVATVTFTKWRRNKALQQAVDVEKAWDNMKANNTTANRKAYVKAVKRNNRWAWLTGNTKYSKSNYWDTGSSNALSTDGGDLADKLQDTDFTGLFVGDNISLDDANMDQQLTRADVEDVIETIGVQPLICC